MPFRPITGQLRLSTGGGASAETLLLIRQSVGITTDGVYVPDEVRITGRRSDAEVVPARGYLGPREEVGGVERPVIWASEESDTPSSYRVVVLGASGQAVHVGTIDVPTGSGPLTVPWGTYRNDPE